jgi:hypothetical protein
MFQTPAGTAVAMLMGSSPRAVIRGAIGCGHNYTGKLDIATIVMTEKSQNRE